MLGVDHPTDVSWTTTVVDPMPLQCLGFTRHFVESEVVCERKIGLDVARCFLLELAIGEAFFVTDELDLVLVHHHHLPDRVQD